MHVDESASKRLDIMLARRGRALYYTQLLFVEMENFPSTIENLLKFNAAIMNYVASNICLNL